MKLAIILSGRIQDDEEQYQNIMNVIVKNHDADFFICYPQETEIEKSELGYRELQTQKDIPK